MARKKTKPSLPDDARRWKGPEQLWPFLVAVADLSEDPVNTNTHDEDSIDAIAASFKRFGQQKPFVSDADGIVRAGNGGLRAVCQRLDWTHVAVVRSDLIGSELTAFAIADNKTPKFARIDQQRLLEQLQSIASEEDSPIEATGYSESEIQGLLDQIADAHLKNAPPDGQTQDPQDPANFEPGDADAQGRLDERGEIKCPNCGELISAELVHARRREARG
jgi:ParB-like chromosome segregation protein Spo0J